MNIDRYIKNNRLKIIVKPNSSKNQILAYDSNKQALKIAIAAKPEKGKANQEVIKFFSKLLNKKIKIISGLKSREKTLLIVPDGTK